MTPRSPHRRRLLQGLGAVGVVGLFPRPGRATTLGAGADPLGQRLEALLPHTESASVVGRAYLRIAPHERQVGRLVALLGLDGDAGILGPDVEALRRDLARRTRRDFAEGHVVMVQGWMLALTEVRLCALAALCSE
jgi:hypothetical protein